MSVSTLLISDCKGSQIWHKHQSARVFCATSRLCYRHDTMEEVLVLERTRICLGLVKAVLLVVIKTLSESLKIVVLFSNRSSESYLQCSED